MVSTKEEIRREMLSLRHSQGSKENMDKSRAIKRKLWALVDFVQAEVVSFYISTKGEVQTEEMVCEALAMDKRVVVPFIDNGKNLLLTELKEPGVELTPGPYAILQPDEKYLRPVSLSQVELIIVPGLAFDHKGHRVGFGKGFYDGLLAGKGSGTICVGLAFQFQILEEVPSGKHDVPMDVVISEKVLMRPNARQGDGGNHGGE